MAPPCPFPVPMAAIRARPLASWLVGAERFAEALEVDGLIPAPYFARAHWVAALHLP